MVITAFNPDTPNGAQPVGTLSGAPWNANLRVYGADGGGSDIFRGDLVNSEADGYVDQYDAADTGWAGVFVGMSGVELRSVAISEALGYYDASAGASENLLVVTAFGLLVEMQEDGDTDPLELADRFSNVEIIDGGGSTTTGLSGMELDSSSHATTNTFPLTLISLVDRPNNQLGDTDTSTPNARWICVANSVLATTGRTGV